MAAPIRMEFTGGSRGEWAIVSTRAIIGDGLPEAARLMLRDASQPEAVEVGARWVLRGATGHLRYVEQREKEALAGVTPPLGRRESTCAVMIPIRKNDSWWELPQDARRAILEQRSQHIDLGLRYLPGIARRLYHSRELGEPFDFVTWFEFAPEELGRFDELTAALRATEEWSYVEREVELRLSRES